MDTKLIAIKTNADGTDQWIMMPCKPKLVIQNPPGVSFRFQIIAEVTSNVTSTKCAFVEISVGTVFNSATTGGCVGVLPNGNEIRGSCFTDPLF